MSKHLNRKAFSLADIATERQEHVWGGAWVNKTSACVSHKQTWASGLGRGRNRRLDPRGSVFKLRTKPMPLHMSAVRSLLNRRLATNG